jgi:hypothetical protein
MQPFFMHPECNAWKVYILFDAAHMLKLMRNTLAEKGIFCDKDGKQIRWQHIVDLQNLQDAEGLKAANRLKRSHVEWYTQKMKVSLAAQTFSRSVASSLEFVSRDLKLPKFADCDATVQFIRVMDQLFDTLNSKYPWAREFKSVMRPSNEQFWRPFLQQAAEYLVNLKLQGRPLHETQRKTTVIGFLATIASVQGLYDDFVATNHLKYLATYRLSQDHIELTFNVVRSRGRWNNNPTVGQFRSAYRRLLMKHDIKPTKTGNAKPEQNDSILPATPIETSCESVVTTAEILQNSGVPVDNNTADHSYCVTVDKIQMSEFSQNIVVYIAGFVARKLLKQLQCIPCKASLLDSDNVGKNCLLIQRKDAGGLLFPSKSLVDVCVVTERCIRFVSGCSRDSVPHQRNMRLALQIAVIERTPVASPGIDSRGGIT